jgi:hypothetical protein
LWLVLVCGACARQVVQPTPLVEVVPITRQPAGYYPGTVDGFISTPTTERAAWLDAHHAAIDDIQNRIVDIKAGRREPGCIGQDTFTCVASLAQKFAIADDYVRTNSNIFAETKYDVNGKPIIPKITFDGYVPETAAEKDRSAGNPYERIVQGSNRAPTLFFLTLGPQGLVSKLGVRLAADPTFARTQEEYDKTGAYETVAALTARTCPALSRAEVATWIENTIKPNSASYNGKIKRGVAQLKISRQTKFCGRSFQFDSIWAARTYNPYRTGPSGGMFLIVE